MIIVGNLAEVVDQTNSDFAALQPTIPTQT